MLHVPRMASPAAALAQHVPLHRIVEFAHVRKPGRLIRLRRLQLAGQHAAWQVNRIALRRARAAAFSVGILLASGHSIKTVCKNRIGRRNETAKDRVVGQCRVGVDDGGIGTRRRRCEIALFGRGRPCRLAEDVAV
jgi:hypothetical protein